MVFRQYRPPAYAKKMADKVPAVVLNNGRKMPAVGLGTSLKNRGRDKTGLVQEVIDAVEYALDIGYRSIDTAWSYNIEEEIGVALKKKLAENKVSRDELFITTKLPNNMHEPERVVDGLRKSLKKLQLDYVDLYLIHSPMGAKYIDDETVLPVDENGRPLMASSDHIAVWKEVEKAVHLGLTRSIGLSNFNHFQIQKILDQAEIKPANLQVESHAYFMQHPLFEFCKKNGISFTCYAPIGSPELAAWLGKASSKPTLLEDPVVKRIGDDHKKTSAQVLLRYLVERGRVVIPKSTNKQRLQENLNLFDFEFRESELAQMDGLDQNLRYFDDIFLRYKDSPDYPFNVPF